MSAMLRIFLTLFLFSPSANADIADGFFFGLGSSLQYLSGKYVAEGDEFNETTAGGIRSPRINSPWAFSALAGYSITPEHRVLLRFKTFTLNSIATFYGSNTGTLFSDEVQSHWRLEYRFHWPSDHRSLLDPFVWAGIGPGRATNTLAILNSDPAFSGDAKISGNGSNLGIGIGNAFSITNALKISAFFSFERYFIAAYEVLESSTASFMPGMIIHNPHDIRSAGLTVEAIYEF